MTQRGNAYTVETHRSQMTLCNIALIVCCFPWCFNVYRCKVGQAKATPAFNMTNAKHIFHAVGPDYGSCSTDVRLVVVLLVVVY